MVFFFSPLSLFTSDRRLNWRLFFFPDRLVHFIRIHIIYDAILEENQTEPTLISLSSVRRIRLAISVAFAPDSLIFARGFFSGSFFSGFFSLGLLFVDFLSAPSQSAPSDFLPKLSSSGEASLLCALRTKRPSLIEGKRREEKRKQNSR